MEKIKQDGEEYVTLHGFNINVNKQTCDEINLKEMVEDLRLAKDKAEESERLKSLFLANMSHEIRTPMNAIVGFSSLLPEAKDEARDEYILLIQTNNELLLNIVNEVLDLSVIESGMKVQRDDVDLASYFNDIAISLKLRSTNPNVAFIIDNPYETLNCSLDKTLLAQIISNLTTNAIKFTKAGYIKVGYIYEDGMLEL